MPPVPDVHHLFDAAMEAWERSGDIDLFQKTLEIDPDHSDTLTLLSAYAETVEMSRLMLERSVAVAADRLGPNFEKKYKGVFWLDLDTRPYMRALCSLAHLEEVVGNRSLSIKMRERLLKLNPTDNQGIRYGLIGQLLAERRLAKTKWLLDTYENESSAWFEWGRVLYFFCMKDRPTATKRLKIARQQNPFVELFLTERRPMPELMPNYYGFGDEDEAILTVNDLGEAWYRRENALFWLGGQLSGDSALIRHVARIIDRR